MTAVRRLGGCTSGQFKKPASRIGFAFDIDGVLLKGRRVLEQGRESLGLLTQLKVPYILLTNGGGVTEASKATELSNKLGVDIAPSQVVLSHSPMHVLAAKYSDRVVLIIGKDACLGVASSYGFKRPVLADHVLAWNPSISPFTVPRTTPLPVLFNAVLVFHDSWDWGRDIQIMCDVARSQNGHLGTLSTGPQSVPFYFSNSDFVWSNEFPLNRFAQGGFRYALERVYEELTGHSLVYTKYGKPEHATYLYAQNLLMSHAKALWPNESLPCRTVYAVGDNPASDIHGANQHGWESILVKTGVWNAAEHGHDHGAKYVVHDVKEAVKLALTKELL